jgi:fermentation-respiration switch protein FrsA (DUF1100 family)
VFSRKVFTREPLIGASVVLVLGCAAFVYGLRWLESLMTFRPARVSAAQLSTPEGAESVWFNSADGTRLNGWFFESASKPAVATIIFFPGNGGNVSNVGWLGQRFARHVFNFLGFDYRGYGGSEGARILFAVANEPKKLLIVPGAGHVVFGSAGEQYLISSKRLSVTR